MATPANLLTIPSELRNAIYFYVFTTDSSQLPPLSSFDTDPDTLATSLHLIPQCPGTPPKCAPPALRLLQVCRRIHTEAHLLALSMTTFHLTGESPYPAHFAARTACLRPPTLTGLRHITVTSRISSLRAMNEQWAGLPFGNADLQLDTLTIVPTRADSSRSAYQEVADLSQSHTLAYVFAETLKGLRNVGCVQVMNRGCFNEVVWRLVYRATVYRMWRWGGGRCGVRFECSGDGVGGGEEWFRIWLRDGGGEGSEVGDEVLRLVGETGDLPVSADEIGVGG